MNTLRIVFHLARADFFERIRRYNFLLTLGIVLFLGYTIASGQLILMVGSRYRGVINSAWVGGLMSTYIGFFLGFFGFYLVKGSILRDYETGVGQIMATTPLKRIVYTLGKWLSNFSVLGIMVLILAVVAVIMQLVYREDPVMDWWALLSPFLLLVLPYMAFTAALAVVFETIPWLSGGLGNLIYFFLFTGVIILLSFSVFGNPPSMDVIGMGFLEKSMQQAVLEQYPDSIVSFMLSPASHTLQTFRWGGITWTAEVVFARLAVFLVSIGLAGLSAVFFDRFNPSSELLIRRKRKAPARLDPIGAPEIPSASTAISGGRSTAQLTPLALTRVNSRFGAIFVAEMKLIFKGQHWWWYVTAIGVVAAQFIAPMSFTRTLLLVGWIWPFLILSGLGCRENRFDTRQIVFSAQHPIFGQIPAAYLSAVVVTAIMGFGALAQYILAGETFHVLGWLNGVFFIPSLALACGVLTGSNKAFEVLYVPWIYLIYQGISFFDFANLVPNSQWFFYAPLTLVLLTVAVFVRWQQLSGKGKSR